MTGVHTASPRGASPRGAVRVVALVVALAVAAGGGVLAAELVPEDEQPLVVAAPEELDVEPVAELGATLVSALQADLPVPLDPPANPRAATPELVHGWLEIPSIGLSQGLFEGVTLTAIDRGPSHWPGTAMPGELGNMVIAGHRTTKTRPFWDLDLVQPGAEMVITMVSGARHVYTLDRTEVVDDQDIHIIDQSYGYRATLFGCHPKGSAAQRIVGHFTLQSSTPAPPTTTTVAPVAPTPA
jgi:LPXTG-site transpeptidase (sortase) family protein